MKTQHTEQSALRKIRRMAKKHCTGHSAFNVQKGRGMWGHVYVANDRNHLVDEDASAIRLLERLEPQLAH
jgi:hypothetical protein